MVSPENLVQRSVSDLDNMPPKNRQLAAAAVELRRQFFVTPFDHVLEWKLNETGWDERFLNDEWDTPKKRKAERLETVLAFALSSNHEVALHVEGRRRRRQLKSVQIVYGSRFGVNSSNPWNSGNDLREGQTGFKVPIPLPELHTYVHENMHIVHYFLNVFPDWEKLLKKRFAEEGFDFRPTRLSSLRKLSMHNLSLYPASKNSSKSSIQEMYAEALTEYVMAKMFRYKPRPFSRIIGETAEMLCSPAAIEQSGSLRQLHQQFFRQTLVEGFGVWRLEFGDKNLNALVRQTLHDDDVAAAVRNHRPDVGRHLKQAISGQTAFEFRLPSKQDEVFAPSHEWTPARSLPQILRAAMRVAELRWPSVSRRTLEFIEGDFHTRWSTNKDINKFIDRELKRGLSLGVHRPDKCEYLYSPLLRSVEKNGLAQRLNRDLDVNWFGNDADAREFCALFTAILPTAREFHALDGFKFLQLEEMRLTKKSEFSPKRVNLVTGLGPNAVIDQPVSLVTIAAALAQYCQRHTLEVPSSTLMVANVLDRWMGRDAPNAANRQTALQAWIQSGANGPSPASLPSLAVDLIDEFREGTLGGEWHYASSLNVSKVAKTLV